jgi:hypothetical protein
MSCPRFATKDSVEVFYKDWGGGAPQVVECQCRCRTVKYHQPAMPEPTE